MRSITPLRRYIVDKSHTTSKLGTNLTKPVLKHSLFSQTYVEPQLGCLVLKRSKTAQF